MSINTAVWTNAGNLSGTIDSNTVAKIQGAIGFPGSASAFGGLGVIPGSLYTLSGKTTEAVATLQTSTWFDLHSMPGAIMEVLEGATTALYMGSLSVEMTNDGTNIYTVYQDNNPTIGQTLNTPILLPQGFRFVRAKATPTVSNVGSLEFQIRVLGQDAQNLFNAQLPGVMHLGPQTIFPLLARTTNINTTVDFKVPAGALGFDVWVHQTALTGTSATYTIARKDPVSGVYGTVATYSTLASAAISSTGDANLAVAAGITATANVSISASPGTHWGLQTTGTNTSVTQSTSVSFTMG